MRLWRLCVKNAGSDGRGQRGIGCANRARYPITGIVCRRLFAAVDGHREDKPRTPPRDLGLESKAASVAAEKYR